MSKAVPNRSEVTLSSFFTDITDEGLTPAKGPRDQVQDRGREREDDPIRYKMSGLQRLLEEMQGNLFEFNQFLREQTHDNNKFIPQEDAGRSRTEGINVVLEQIRVEMGESTSRLNTP